jgi:hypothetical protein
MGKKSEESIDHLLTHCEVARDYGVIFLICLMSSELCRDG